MAFVRSIGRWTMTALVINCIIGAGIFGLPGELNRLLGRASPFAVIFAALGVAVIMACVAEVASQFSEPGGPYLYVRTAFGRFLGMQIGWLELLSVISGLAALSILFVDYLAAFLPRPLSTWERASLIALVIAFPTAVNYRGVRSGGWLSNLTTLAKLAPLTLLILVGLARFANQPRMIQPSTLTGLFEGLLVIRPRLFHSLPIWFSKHILQNLSDSVSRKFFPELNSENALVLRQLRVGPLSNLFLVCRSATFSDDQS